MSYSALQNGSDIRGIAMENDKGYAVNMTEKASEDLARAFVRRLKAITGEESPKVAVGRDSRLSGEALLKAAVRGIKAEGAEAIDFELASTPAMFMATVLENYTGSIMITASHLPWFRNGMKFFDRDGGLEKEDIKELVEAADQIAANETMPEGIDDSAVKVDFMETYAAFLRKKIIDGAGNGDRPLEGRHIIVDAGNGAGGFYVTRVLEPLGANTEGSQFLEPDGHFPNHVPNPEDKEAAESAQKATFDSGADLGIIFDTDVDRAGAILPSGKKLVRNELIAIISSIVLREHPGTTIVTDSITSDGLHEFITSRGGQHIRFKRGYRNVIDESIRLNNAGIDSQLAIETSGHGALKENFFLDDGAYLMVKILIEMGKGEDLDKMISDLDTPAESVEIRFPVKTELLEGKSLQENGDRVLDFFKEAADEIEGWFLEEENYEGVRFNTNVSHGGGWLLLRKSLHEPIMPLNIESSFDGGSLLMAKQLLQVLSREETLDVTPLEEFIR